MRESWTIEIPNQRCPLMYWAGNIRKYICDRTMLECTKEGCTQLPKPTENKHEEESVCGVVQPSAIEVRKEIAELVIPNKNTRTICKDCNEGYPVFVDGFIVPANERLQECYTKNHDLIHQLFHDGIWVELFIDHGTLPSRQSYDVLVDMLRGAISMTENGQLELAIKELRKALKELESE